MVHCHAGLFRPVAAAAAEVSGEGRHMMPPNVGRLDVDKQEDSRASMHSGSCGDIAACLLDNNKDRMKDDLM